MRGIYEKNESESSASLNSLFVLFSHVYDPLKFEDAIKEEKWVSKMDEEIDDIEKNDTRELVNLRQGK